MPPGLYDELELEIEEIDDDHGDGVRDRLMRELMVGVRTEFPE